MRLIFIYCTTLLSFAFADPASTPTTTTPNVNDRPTLFGIADAHEELSILRDVYKKTEMKFKMEQSRDATILMPTNQGFEYCDIRKLSYPMIVQILNYHNLPEVHKFGELDEGDHSFETVEGSHINVTVARKDGTSKFSINKQASVISDHIDTVNGVAYMISRILIPSCISKEVEKALGDERSGKLQNLDVPEHVQASNRENDRYDETPATKMKIKEPEADGAEPTVGTLTLRETKVNTEERPSLSQTGPGGKIERRRANRAPEKKNNPSTPMSLYHENRVANRMIPNEVKAADPRQQQDLHFKPSRARTNAEEKLYKVDHLPHGYTESKSQGSTEQLMTHVERSANKGLLT